MEQTEPSNAGSLSIYMLKYILFSFWAPNDCASPIDHLIITRMRQIIENNEYYQRTIITRNRIAAGILIFTQISLTIAHGFVVRPTTPAPSQDISNQQGLVGCTALALLTLLGVGLNSIPGNNRIWSTMGFCLLITALSIQVHPLCLAFWDMVNPTSSTLSLGWNSALHYYLTNHSVLSTSTLNNTFMSSIKCALSLVVVFSSLCGRTGIFQAVIIGVAGPFFYQMNAQIATEYAMDFGGTISVFCFGGVMGLTASAILNHCQEKTVTVKHPLRKANSLLFALKGFGALLCWVSTPFLCFDFPNELNHSWQSLLNSIIGVSSCVVSVVGVDCIILGQLDYRAVVMSPLAGAVGIASSAPFIFNLAQAVVLGIVVGLLVQILLKLPHSLQRVLFTDNRSGMIFAGTGILGGFLSAVVLQLAKDKPQYQLSHYGSGFSATAYDLYDLATASHQAIGTLISIGFGAAVGTGLGFLLWCLGAQGRQDHYHDQTYWLTQTDSISTFREINQSVEEQEWRQESRPQTQNFKQLMLKEPYYVVSKHSIL